MPKVVYWLRSIMWLKAVASHSNQNVYTKIFIRKHKDFATRTGCILRIIFLFFQYTKIDSDNGTHFYFMAIDRYEREWVSFSGIALWASSILVRMKNLWLHFPFLKLFSIIFFFAQINEAGVTLSWSGFCYITSMATYVLIGKVSFLTIDLIFSLFFSETTLLILLPLPVW